jgi:hypothetical protein
MSTWNLQNDTSVNATEIQNIPVDIPPIANNEVLVYNSTTQSFVAENIASAGGITNVIGVGSISPVYSVSAGVASLTGITGDGLNTTASLVDSGQQIQIALDTDITINSITSTTGDLFINPSLRTVGTSGNASVIAADSNNSTGSSAVLALGNDLTNSGYFFVYQYGSPDLNLAQLSGSVGGAFNIDLNGGTQTIIGGCTITGPLSVQGSIQNSNQYYDSTGSSGTTGQALTSTTGATLWSNVISYGAFESAVAEFTGGTITVQPNSYYMDQFGATYNLPNTPPANTVFGIMGGENPITIHSSNTVESQDQEYAGSCTITNIGVTEESSYLELIFVNNSGQISWNIIGIIGAWNFNGVKTSDVRDINEIRNVTITSPISGQYLEYNGSSWVNAAIPGVATTIYSGDSTLASNRIVTQGGFNLEFTGGGNFQINNSAITTQTLNGMNTMVVADTNGILNSYALTKTCNSVRFPVNIQNMTNTNNAINVYSATAGDACFIMDVYFAEQGSNDSTTIKWIVMGHISNNTGWCVVPTVCSGTNGDIATGSVYYLQARIGFTSISEIELRLVRPIWNGINPVHPATMTIIRREMESSSSTYSLSSQTPYSDSYNFDIALQNIYLNKIWQLNGYGLIGSSPSITFTYIPGQTLWLSSSVSFQWGSSAGIIGLTYNLNGNIMSYGLSMSLPGSAITQMGTLSSTNIDLGPGTLVQNGFLVAGTNTLNITFTIAVGVGVSTTNQPYSFSLQTSF